MSEEKRGPLENKFLSIFLEVSTSLFSASFSGAQTEAGSEWLPLTPSQCLLLSAGKLMLSNQRGNNDSKKWNFSWHGLSES